MQKHTVGVLREMPHDPIADSLVVDAPGEK